MSIKYMKVKHASMGEGYIFNNPNGGYIEVKFGNSTYSFKYPEVFRDEELSFDCGNMPKEIEADIKRKKRVKFNLNLIESSEVSEDEDLTLDDGNTSQEKRK